MQMTGRLSGESAPSGEDLYRPAAVLGSRSRLGRPTPIARVGTWALVAFLLLLMASAVVFFATTSFARRETVAGLLAPTRGSADLTFYKSALVASVHVREGQHVHRGDPVFTLTLDTNLERGATLGDRLTRAADDQGAALADQSEATAITTAAERRQLLSKQEALTRQQATLRESLALQRQHEALDQTTLDGLASIAGKGFVSAIRLRDQQVQVLGDRQAIATLEGQQAQNESDLAGLGDELAQNRASANEADARIRQTRAELEEKRAETAAQSGVVLSAPYDGTVVTMRANVGQAVTPGVPLATIIPTGGVLEAELWAPTRAAGFARVGDEARVMYDAFPYQRFGTATGRITSVSTTPIDPAQLPIAAETKEAMYRIRVALDRQYVSAYGQRWPLSPGARLRADLILERQSLLAWLLDPLLASRDRDAR